MKKTIWLSVILALLLVATVSCDTDTPPVVTAPTSTAPLATTEPETDIPESMPPETDPAETDTPYSEGLLFVSNGDGTCTIFGVGMCADRDIIVPPQSPAGDIVVSIGQAAFQQCYYLRTIQLPDSLTSIGESAFEYCTALVSLEIPDSVISIGKHAFSACTALVEITIPHSITTVDEYTFGGCKALTKVTIPDSITLIAPHSFAYCDNVKVIMFDGTTEQWNAIPKGTMWSFQQAPSGEVVCTDGTIPLE